MNAALNWEGEKFGIPVSQQKIAPNTQLVPLTVSSFLNQTQGDGQEIVEACKADFDKRYLPHPFFLGLSPSFVTSWVQLNLT